MTPLDLTTVLKDAPAGEWIALSSDRSRVVATAETLEAALKAAQLKGENHSIVMKLPPVGGLVL